ncbi:leucyl aminopeptidase [Actinobacillus equuli]|nr:leucyl aminopeptidase [Actinobacillus equuli]
MEAVCFLTELHVKGRSTYWNVRFAVEAIQESLYAYNDFKSIKPEVRRELRRVILTLLTVKIYLMRKERWIMVKRFQPV